MVDGGWRTELLSWSCRDAAISVQTELRPFDREAALPPSDNPDCECLMATPCCWQGLAILVYGQATFLHVHTFPRLYPFMLTPRVALNWRPTDFKGSLQMGGGLEWGMHCEASKLRRSNK